MKEKIITFVIGFLVGIVLSTGMFCTYSLVSNINDNNKNTHSIKENIEPNGKRSKKEKTTTSTTSESTNKANSEETN